MTPSEIHDEAVRLALEAYDRAGSDTVVPGDWDASRKNFERHARERLSQLAQALTLDHSHGCCCGSCLTGT